MTFKAAMLPVFAQMLLTFALFVMMARARYGAVSARQVRLPDIALGGEAWPERVKQIGNAFHNQLELPLLYYALVAFTLLYNRVDGLFVVMSWLFVVARLAHAYVHVTSNFVPRRFMIFGMGASVLLLMWLIFAARVILSS